VRTPDHKAEEFVEWLGRLLNDRAAMATLRRGLGKPPGAVYEMDRYVLKFISGQTANYEPYYLVASLFALWHQGRESTAPSPHSNLGASLRALVDKEAEDGAREAVEKRIERRLVALLNCHRDDLPDRLRHIVSLLRSEDIPINWAQLLKDIHDWDRESRSVQRDWSRAFWTRAAAGDRPATIDNEREEKEGTNDY
jgi:CRISPR system Cascade subunit CasB